jgi:hypothetical protein
MSSTKTVVILGMHRSGTSLLANWLQSCNLPIGDRLMGKADSNKKGHFEDLDFVDIHEQIFAENGMAYGGLTQFPKMKVNDYYYQKLKWNVHLKNELNKQWGFKDPRTCLFLDQYRLILPEAHYLIAFRDAAFVVDSLLRRQQNESKTFFTTGNTKQRLTYALKKDKINQAIEAEFTEVFTKAWIHYNNEILRLIDQLPASHFQVVNMQQFDENATLEWLQDAQFELNATPYSEVYQANLINTTPPQLIIPANLQHEVDQVTQSFSQLMA